MQKETWYFIDTGYSDPSYNMALDEMLLHWQNEGKMPPVVRFYDWQPATLSIGYFQKVQKEIDLDAVERHGFGFVRRPTGGRGVLHDNELTYSVVVPESHPEMPATVTEAYRVISEGILQGFRELGFHASFAIPRTDEEKQALKNPRSAVCFDAPSWYELVVEGRKVAGSAQTRQKGVILQHGSIILDVDEEKLFDLFKYPSERVRRRMQEGFKEKAVSLRELAGHPVPMEDVRPAFKKGFEKGMNIELKPYTLTPEEEQFVYDLAKDRYANEEWTYRK
ncbi:lipoate--protein ligase family protein [Salsuginibacillus kocurii]|uniref:lipoate--protein ligase family protein n=1 Tax=Salsuginibacillus kocurii TaxID=427078 RepID=UPI000361837A|nr:biotin/lipoate A/B protein ligase family protein [Salsuginibacillus kocurii]